MTQYTGSASGGTPVEMRVFADGMGRSLHTVRSAAAQSGRRYVKTGRLVYDPVGRVIRKSQTDWAGDDEIDAFRESDREKNPTITEYDSSGRVKKVILPPGFSGEAETSVSYTYNDPWETIETHSVGRSKSTLKNGRNQVLYVEDSGRGDDDRTVDAKIGFAYDMAGNRVKKMDLNGASMSLDIPSNLFVPNVKDTSGNNIACWRYNAFGQMTDSSDPDLGYSGITYNPFGDVASRTDALDRTVTMDYDRLGRIVRKDLPGMEGAVVYRYDSLAGCDYALGRMVSIDDPAQNKQFSYDPLGRVKRETRTVKGAGRTRYVTTFEYDLLDHKLLINYPVDAKTDSAMSVSYHYCPMGVTAVEIDNGSIQKQIVQDVVYNEFGQMTELHRGNNTVTYYTYDIKGRLENLLTTARHNGQTWKVQDLKYEFKVDNSISAVENTPDVAFDGACQTLARYEYSYDGLNRLVHARGSYVKTRTVPSPGGGDPLNPVDGPITKKFELGYDYSRNGNLTAKTMYDTETGTVDDAWTYNYGNHAATRIETTRAGLRYQMTYDAAGNMISQVDHSNNIAKKMAYDSYNRIRKVTNQHNGRLMGQYWYDDQGFRVRRKARYLDNGEERNVEVVQPSMYFGVEISRDNLGIIHPKAGFCVNHIYLNGVRIAAALPDGTAQYYLTDQVDSVKVVTNDAGLVVTSHEYLPFGEDWITEGDTKNAPKYNSQELDKESGYYFYNARHYDPEIGRFVTADSVVPRENDSQSWNRFSYCSNNPIIYKDPTGHKEEGAIDHVVGFVKGATSTYASDLASSTPVGMLKNTVDTIKNTVQEGKNLYQAAKSGTLKEYAKGKVDNLKKEVDSVIQNAKDNPGEFAGGAAVRIAEMAFGGKAASENIAGKGGRGLLTAEEEIKGLPRLADMAKKEIRSLLKENEFSKVKAKSGGEVWTKAASDGNTASVRIDPSVKRAQPKGFADELPHVHKETVASPNVRKGNYAPNDPTLKRYDDFGDVTRNVTAAHIQNK